MASTPQEATRRNVLRAGIPVAPGCGSGPADSAAVRCAGRWRAMVSSPTRAALVRLCPDVLTTDDGRARGRRNRRRGGAA
jgi:hypothetical protein